MVGTPSVGARRAAPTAVHGSSDKCLAQMSTIPSSACSWQCARFRPSKLNLGGVVQESCKHRCLRTHTMPSLACCLQYAVVLTPSILKCGTFVQEPCGHRRLFESTMSSSACCLQYADLLLPWENKVRSPHARAMKATSMVHMHHAILGMLLAIHPRLDSVEVIERKFRARVI